MWYFAWVLGTAFAVCFSVLNAMWYESKQAKNSEENQ